MERSCKNILSVNSLDLSVSIDSKDIALGKATPLTQAQEGLWYGQRLDPDNAIYNTGEYIEICGKLDIERFKAAVNQVMTEADALSLQMFDDQESDLKNTKKSSQNQYGKPLQVLNKARRPTLEIIDLQHHSNAINIAQQAMQVDMDTALDLTYDQLAVQRLYKLSDEHFYWYQRAHHLLTDAWGQSLINTHVAALYRGDKDRQQLTPYQVLLEADQAYRSSEKERTDAAYWHQEFKTPPTVTDLFFNDGGVAITANSTLKAQKSMSAEFEKTLSTLCEQENLTWPDVLTALTAAYICRYGNTEETVIGVPYMGRMGQACARIPATVMNVLPLRVKVDPHEPIKDFLLGVMKNLRDVKRHGLYRSEQLRRDLGLLGGNKRLYGASINILPFDCAQLELPGLQTIRHTLGNGPVEDLTITFRSNAFGQGIRLELDGNPNRYRQEDIQTHIERLVQFLNTATQVNQLASVPTLTPTETQQWVYMYNDTKHVIPNTTLVHLMQTSWQQSPQAIALEYEGQQLTYAQLDHHTKHFAQALTSAGVRQGDLVGIALPRSFELVLALVATLRSGAAYLPLDIDSPVERIATIIHTASPKVILSNAQTRTVLPTSSIVWEVNHNNAHTPANDQPFAISLVKDTYTDINTDTDIDVAQPHDAAYVIYTSGSTGTPKGVVIEHDAIVNRLLWMQTHYNIESKERILQKTPVTFDVSVWEFFLPLISGATLVIAPPDAHKDPQQLALLMEKSRITTMHFVPSMLSIFLAQQEMLAMPQSSQFAALRLVFCSGEALPAELRDRFHAVLGGQQGAQLHNLYGPTEAAVDVSCWEASCSDTSHPVPIGFPIWNTQLYILDENLHPTPPSVTGHLYLAGRQLARGYLGRDDLTQERFVANPFVAGKKMYATGDLARWREDGAVIFLGRSDFQIKIRGQRVELEEIETTIAHVDGVSQVVVIAREDEPGDQRIAAYVVAQTGAALNEETLQQKVSAHLPDYMLPSAFIMLDSLPTTHNGKLDRKALPAPIWTKKTGKFPASASEQAVATLFAKALGTHETIYADDDFFALGGHSLLAAQLMLEIRAQWGHTIGLGTLFEHPTVAQLAGYIDQLNTQSYNAGLEGFGSVLQLRSPLSKTTKRPALFCIHPAGGIDWCYGALARSISPDRSVIGLQSPALDLTTPFAPTLNAMAASYVDTIIELQAQGPYHLLGWSIGGIIAQAMAVELQKRDLTMGMLCMFDSYPSDCWCSEEAPPKNAALKALLHIAGHNPEGLEDAPLTQESVIAFLRKKGHPLGYLSDAMLQGIIRVVESNNQLVRTHQHQHYNGNVLYFRAALDHVGENLYPTHWQPYVNKLDVHNIPTLHAHMLLPIHIKTIAPLVNAALQGAYT